MRSPLTLIRCALLAILALVLTGVGLGMEPSRADEAPLPAFVDEVPDVLPVTPSPVDSLELALSLAAPHLDPVVLDLALKSYANAVRSGLVPDPSMLTVIDYSRPSDEPRFFVFDLEARDLVFEELVAHGKNTGRRLATEFSNVESSLKTSLGLFVTQDTYVGKHGRSLRLEGLETGFNDRARARAIVIHGADYVNAATAKSQGRLGRSLGCPAVRPEIATPLIKAVKDGGLLFAYYPDQRWLDRSTYLN
jgi:hypothetical protein